MTTTHAFPTLSTSAGPRATSKQVVAGRVLTGTVSLFLAFDAIIHLAQEAHAVAFTEQIGAPEWLTVLCGAVLAVCLVAYWIPRTAAVGAVLLTGYLGGAVATNLVTGQPLVNAGYALVTAVLVWAGLWPRDARIRNLVR